jgi:hypothetical protein
MYFALLFPATCFGSFFQNHLQAGLYFLKKTMYTTDRTSIDYEKIEYSLKMAPKEGTET